MQQQEILDDIETVLWRYVIAGNQSGKSSLAAREIAWIVTGTHPTWKRPERWGTEALLIIVAGKSRSIMEVELWGKKLKPFLDMALWKENRSGNALQSVVQRETGDTILFLSHADSSATAISNLQSYVAHYVWLDEMPTSYRVLEELQRRVDSRRGYFLCTFTPKFRNDKIKKVVDAASLPLAKRYRLSKLDNPLYAATRDEELQKLEGYSEQHKATVLYGAWMASDDLLYQFDHELHGGIPDGYAPGHRHVVVVDPATESKLGYLLAAEDPKTLLWWIVKAKYIEGIYVPTKIIEAVEAEHAGLNVIERRSDGHESWFIRQAKAMPDGRSYDYRRFTEKKDRKRDLIKDVQEALGKRVKVASWSACDALHDEFTSCERNPVTGAIVNGARFHCLDSLQYFVYDIPKPSVTQVYASYEDRLYFSSQLADREAELAREAAAKGSQRARSLAATSSMEKPLPTMRQFNSRVLSRWRR